MSAKSRRHSTMTVTRVRDTSQDAIGGVTHTTHVIAKDEPCHVWALTTGTARMILGREGVSSTHRLQCSSAIDITDQHRIKTNDGNDYEVVFANRFSGTSAKQEVDLILRVSDAG
jgi:head-tail adaptor